MSQAKKSILDKLTNIETAKDFEENNSFLPIKDWELSLPKENKENDWSMLENEYEGQLAIDVYGTKDAIIVRSTIAGAKPEDIEILVNDDILTIRGKRETEEKIDENDYFYQECYWGGFSRSVILPVPIQTDKVTAVLKGGILTITLPKVRQKNSKIKIEHIEEE